MAQPSNGHGEARYRFDHIQGFDLDVRGAWMLAAELGAADRLAERVPVERRAQPCRRTGPPGLPLVGGYGGASDMT